MHFFVLIALLISLSAIAAPPAVKVITGACRSDGVVTWAGATHDDCEATVVVNGKSGPAFDLVSVHHAEGEWHYDEAGGKVAYQGLALEARAAGSGLREGIYIVWGDLMLSTPGGVLDFTVYRKTGNGPMEPIDRTRFAESRGKLVAIYKTGGINPRQYILVGPAMAGPFTIDTSMVKLIEKCPSVWSTEAECTSEVIISSTDQVSWKPAPWVKSTVSQ